MFFKPRGLQHKIISIIWEDNRQEKRIQQKLLSIRIKPLSRSFQVFENLHTLKKNQLQQEMVWVENVPSKTSWTTMCLEEKQNFGSCTNTPGVELQRVTRARRRHTRRKERRTWLVIIHSCKVSLSDVSLVYSSFSFFSFNSLSESVLCYLLVIRDSLIRHKTPPGGDSNPKLSIKKTAVCITAFLLRYGKYPHTNNLSELHG